MANPKLTPAELQSKLADLHGWSLDEQSAPAKLQRVYQFPDFVAALAFVNQLAELAEQAGHHPDIDIRYNRVVLGLVTHDSGGITENDTKMAAAINDRFPAVG